ncbi:OmpW family outer membrane protein [Arundinibacter roseus]|uniref:Porin family protein n=1 Tax=Arundinibacter roseus TaxID=2070510 RepID=A0A4R4KB89_9BACT|nr:outer membrane beta-barrel protein [Arundinibacter roseus]TDB63439.1 porin family protein [Arundinibacter roseus]
MKNYLILALFLMAGNTFAQSSTPTPWLNKGEIQVGVGFGTGFGDYSGTTVRTRPYIQYFIKDRWAVQLEGQYEVHGLDKQQEYLREDLKRPQYLGAGIATQYHFLKTNRFSLYGQAGYTYGRYRVYTYDFSSSSLPFPTRTITTDYGRFSLGAGVQYRLGDRWRIHALVERQAATELKFKGGATSVQVGVSFRIR